MRYDEDDYDPDYGNPGEGPNKDRDMIIAIDKLPKICKDCTFLWYDDESFALCSAQGSQKLMNSNDIKKRDPHCPLKKIYIDNNGLWGTVFLGNEMVEEFQKVLKKWKERNEQLFGNSE